jgi:hypothetical protein
MGYLPGFDVDNTVLGNFAKFWDIDSGIDQGAINDELSGTAVGGLLYNFKKSKNARQQVKAVLNVTRQSDMGFIRIDPCLIFSLQICRSTSK